MYPFLFNGLSEIGGVSKAPTNLQAFCGSFINLVFAIAAQFAGAVATPEFLTYMDYFIRLEFGDDYYQRPYEVVYKTNNPGKRLSKAGFDGRPIDKIITDCFEQVVYSMNQPAAARNSQSVFWNIAYFDKPYFEGIFDGFVFPDGTAPIWESTSWLQKRFMKWFNAERLKAILTFPVETVNLVHDGTDFIDKDWAEFTAQMYSEGHSFFTYTSDSVDSLSSCCFDGSQRVRYRDKNHEYETTFAEIPNSGVDFDSLAVWHMGNWKPAKFISLPSKTMLKITVGDREVICTSDHLFPVVNQDGTLQVFDYHARDLVVGDLIPVWHEGDVGKEAITSISPYTENDGTVYCFEISDRLTDTPYFTLANGVITHNCRLKSGITDNTFSYTLGAGGVATGSKSVMTINLNRLVQNVKRKNPDADLAEISEAVREQVKKIHKYQTAFNEIIKENFKARLLPVYDAGFISLEKQYLTTGINGGVEAAEFLGIDIGVNDKYFEFFDAILKPIYEENKAARTDELMWNTEFVPAENLGKLECPFPFNCWKLLW